MLKYAPKIAQAKNILQGAYFEPDSFSPQFFDDLSLSLLSPANGVTNSRSSATSSQF